MLASNEITINQLDYATDNPPGDWEGLCDLADGYWILELGLYYLGLAQPTIYTLRFPESGYEPATAIQKLGITAEIPQLGNQQVYVGESSLLVLQPNHAYDNSIILLPEVGKTYYRPIKPEQGGSSLYPSPEQIPSTFPASPTRAQIRGKILRLCFEGTNTDSYSDLYDKLKNSFLQQI